jgi:CDP-glycerol glycerophosphotransferase
MPKLSAARVRSNVARVRRAARSEQLAWLRHSPLDPTKVLYESFSGNGILDNPEALFRRLLAQPDLQHLRHVWVIDETAAGSSAEREFANDERVSFVKYRSTAYFAALATSKYLINNSTFPPEFGKRAGQVYVNTWHGTPLKAMGYDIPDGIAATRNIIRNLVAVDFLLAGNDATVDMYLKAYRLANIYRGKIVCEGTPRVDRQFVDDDTKHTLRARLRRHGIVIDDDQKIILFAPTWKGSFYAPTNDVRQLRRQIAQIIELVDGQSYRILLKVHQLVYKYAVQDPQLRDMLVPNEVPTNDVLAVTDVLVTDYSSIFMDFLATGRPILFFTPDLGTYEGARGLYLPLEQWPGPICTDIATLARNINALGTGAADDPAVAYSDAYAVAQKRYCSAEDGGAADRVIDIVFRGRETGYDVRSDHSDGRPTVLMYLGGMLPNGITTSALNLLSNIDTSRVDVSVFYQHTTRRDRARLIRLLSPQVRHFPRTGGMNGHKFTLRRLISTGKVAQLVARREDDSPYDPVLAEEWTRCFGDCTFDYTVDFSGYSALWNRILMQGRAASHSIWLHNDLRTDADKVINGKTPRRANLYANFALYRFADHLVSVSAALSRVNSRNLAEFADADKFTFAQNAINYQRIIDLAYGITAPRGAAAAPDALGSTTSTVATRPRTSPANAASARNEPGEPDQARTGVTLPELFDDLMTQFSLREIMDEGVRRSTIEKLLPPARRETHTFVSAGRMSPEKNHERLIRAFDVIHQRFPETRLVLMGTGPLQGELRTLVTELGLNAAVDLAGQQQNPYGVIAGADCFVLSSDYEGQPMVILESMVLGTPVVTTGFDSVQGILPIGQGLVVERSVDALAAGMEESIHGRVHAGHFDYVKYNQAAVEQFYQAIGLDLS